MSSASSTVEQTAQPAAGPEVSQGASEKDVFEPLAPQDLPQIDHLVTEDDTPVDNIFSEKQQRLLTEPLYASWSGPGEGRSFLTLANVGLFYSVHHPPLVPDVLLSLDVDVPSDVWAKHNRSYFIWEMGKVPEVVIEIVSNTKGQETEKKHHRYARIGVPYYVIYDPQQLIQETALLVYELHIGTYLARSDNRLEEIGLGLTLWDGIFEKKQDTWLRWCDQAGNLIPTGAERADQERDRAERLAAQLKALGIEPEA